MSMEASGHCRAAARDSVFVPAVAAAQRLFKQANLPGSAVVILLFFLAAAIITITLLQVYDQLKSGLFIAKVI